MANTSNYLKRKKAEYINFYNKASETATRVSSSIEILNELFENQKKAYTIDGSGGADAQLRSIYERNKKVLNNINNSILPRTKAKINSLNYEIEAALEKEAEEAAALV